MANNEKKQKTIAKRQSVLKKEFLIALQENGLIQVACRKTGIVRQTYYRWRDSDIDFATQVEKALNRGRDVGCDMAESVIMGKIAEKDIGAAKFYLQNNDSRYMQPARARERLLRQEYQAAREALKSTSKNPVDLAERQQALAHEYEEKLRTLIAEGAQTQPPGST